MPGLSILFIRISLIYLVSGFGIGALLLLQKGHLIYPKISVLLPAHIEFLLMGWILQLAMGVAYWILPRFSKPPYRGRSFPVWSSLFLLNIGILLVSLAPLTPMAATLSLPGRVCEIGAALCFAYHAWSRVKPFSESITDS